MILYHGSKEVISSPKVKGSNIHNDYGPAFYMTSDFDRANEWACRNNTIGYVNVYELDKRGLKILDLTDSHKWSVLNWLAVLLHNRTLESGFIRSFYNRLNFLEEHYYVDVSEYDLVKGYRADDAYFRFPLDFVRGNLTLNQLEEAYKLGDLGIQYVGISKKCIDKLVYKKSILSDEKYINQYFESVGKATKRFDDMNKDEDGVRIQDLMKVKK